MKSLTLTLAPLLLSAAGGTTQAADFAFQGELAFHNSTVQIDFSVPNGGSTVRLWSDSWSSGLNFDPTAALWLRSGSGSGSDYALVAVNDDDDSVAPGQGFYDFGFMLPGLATGDYRLTLATAVNAPVGMLLSSGFDYDSQSPIPIAQWDQPTRDINFNDQKGSYWNVHLSGVAQAAVVPEPSEWALLALGLVLVGWRVARR